MGALDLDIPALGVDFYTANMHKWLCTSKGTAFLWVSKPQQPHIRPLVTSHGFGMVRRYMRYVCSHVRCPDEL